MWTLARVASSGIDSTVASPPSLSKYGDSVLSGAAVAGSAAATPEIAMARDTQDRTHRPRGFMPGHSATAVPPRGLRYVGAALAIVEQRVRSRPVIAAVQTRA